MSVEIIPTSTTLRSYRQRCELDGEKFTLDIRFNARMKSWFLDLYDEDGNELAMGRRLTIDTPLITQHSHKTGMPLGELSAFDTTDRKAPPQFQELGDRVLLLYTERVELQEAA